MSAFGDALKKKQGTGKSAFAQALEKKSPKPATPTYADIQAQYGEKNQSLLDRLMGPSYAIGNMAELLFNNKKDTMADLGRAIWQGLTGEKKGTWQTVTHKLPEAVDVRIPEAVPLVGGKRIPVRSAAGFALDVATDPFDKLGFGAKVINPTTGEAERQVLSYAGKGWEDLPGKAGEVARAVDEKAVSVLDNVADWVRSTPLGKWFAQKFSTRGPIADDEFWKLTQEAKNAAEYLVEQEIKKGVTREKALREVVKKTGLPEGDLLDLIERPEVKLTQQATHTFGAHTVAKGETLEKIAKKYGTTADDLRKLNGIDRLMDLKMGQQLKVPVTTERVVSRLADKPQAVSDLVKQYGQENADRLNIERAAGIDTPALDSDVLQYMHRHRTPEAVKAAKKAGVSWQPMLDATVQHGATKERTMLRNLSIKQINDLAQKGELDKVIPGFRGKLYEDNPALVQTLRDIVSAKALAAAEFIDNVVQNPQWATKGEAPSTWVELSENAVKNRFGSKVAGVKFRPDIAEALNKYVKNEFDPSKIDPALSVYDKALGAWKRLTLGLSPTWLKTNAVGNVFNNYLVGVNPAEYSTAAFVQMGKPVAVVSKAGKLYTTQAIQELAGKLRVVDSGLSSDVSRSIQQQMSGKTGGFALFKVNRLVENNGRLANFIDGLRKGLTPQEAVRRVNEALFDYQDLTDWERNVAKRIMPFYTFFRKNAQLQFEHMLTTPGKYTVIPKYRNAVEYEQKQKGQLADKRYLPDWLRQNYPVQIGTTPEGNVLFRTMRGVPAFDVFRSPNELASSNPFSTAMMQAGLGYDPYFGEKIPNRPDSLLGIPMPERYSRALQTLFPPLKTADNLLNPREASPWSTVQTPGLGERLKAALFGKTYERDPLADYSIAVDDWLKQMDEAQRQLAQAEDSGNAGLAWWWRRRIAELEKQEPQ